MVPFSCTGGSAGKYRVSPNDLVFGHSVRGPLSVFKDRWRESDPPTNLIDCLKGFRQKKCWLK